MYLIILNLIRLISLVILVLFFNTCGYDSLNQNLNLTGYTTVYFNGKSSTDIDSLIQSALHSNAFLRSTTSANGGILIYAVGQDGLDYAETLFLQNESKGGSLTIPSGSYKFYAVGFSNATTSATSTQGSLTGTMRCALINSGKPITIGGGSKTINISLTTSDCISSQDYVPSSLRHAEVPMTLALHSCVYGYPFACTGNTCPNCADGDALTYRLQLVSYKKTGGVITQKIGGVQSCIQTNSGGAGLSSPTNAQFPFGSDVSTSPFYAEVGTYTTTSTNCAETPTNTYIFQSGLTTSLNTTTSNLAGEASLGADTTARTANLYVRKATSTMTAKSIGRTFSSTGTCSATGVQSAWCTGGMFTTGTDDGMMNQPYDVVVDNNNGFFYVADASNDRIQKFNLSTGAFVGWIGRILTTGGTCIAGVGNFTGGWCSGGTSQSGAGNGAMNFPTGIAIDSTNGFLYLADPLNHRIQKFDLSNGTFIGWIGRILTTGGTCTAGVGNFTGGWCSGGTSQTGTGDGMMNIPDQIAVDSTNGFLYVSDDGNNRIQKFNLSTGAFVGWIGRILTTGGTCTAGVGNFTGGWCSGGTSQLGDGDGMMAATNGLEVDITNGFLYVTDRQNSRIQKFNLSTGAFVGWIGRILTTGGTCTAGVGNFTGGWCSGGTPQFGDGDGMMRFPSDVALDTINDILYVADQNNHRIQKFKLSTGAFVGWLGRILTTGGTCTAGVGLVTGGFCSGGTSQLGYADGAMDTPSSVAIDTRGFYLYIGIQSAHRIQRITPP